MGRKGIEKKKIKTMNKNKSRNKKKQQERKKHLHSICASVINCTLFNHIQQIKGLKIKKERRMEMNRKNIYKLRTKKNKQRSQKEPGTKYE